MWKHGKINILFSEDILYEYIEKLSHKGVSEIFIKDLIKDLKFFGTFIEINFFHLHTYPKDTDDIAFVLCAENGDANYLVSYDDHLLILNGVYDFKICLPLEFLFDIRE